MSHINSNFGIVTERDINRVSFFNTDTLTPIHQIPVAVDAIGVDLTPDTTQAVVSSQTASTIVQLNLLTEPPAIVASTVVTATGGLRGIACTLDSGVNFGISVSVGSSTPPPFQRVISFNLANQVFSGFTTPAIAAHPTDPIIPSDPIHSLVVAVDSVTSLIKFLHMDANGVLTPSGFPDIPSGGAGPQYVRYTHNGNFVFISNFDSGSLSIVRMTPGGPVPFPPIPVSPNPQGIAISSDDTRVFVLTASTVNRFSFDPSTGFIAPLGSFNHNLIIPHYPDVHQIAIDVTNTRLFITGSQLGLSRAAGDVLAVFTTLGAPLGFIPGIFGNGGVVTGAVIIPTRGMSWQDIDGWKF